MPTLANPPCITCGAETQTTQKVRVVPGICQQKFRCTNPNCDNSVGACMTPRVAYMFQCKKGHQTWINNDSCERNDHILSCSEHQGSNVEGNSHQPSCADCSIL
ncbi:hypothetical protein O181_023649 [Austropuccinia psidii MF-1]|uniref:Uncharacterized protein n=1 Tax=Austropuccinia psidii MF-1 TaxID=1389203 RepID=A0A9Q3CH42_9BASI|nr:hypothetical protein [Austropuccinia psidii MF-1]